MKTAALFVVALLTCPAVAVAQPAPAVPAVIVHYADLNLESTAGARAMLSRVRKAAADACRDSAGMAGTDDQTLRSLDQCYRQSVQRAVQGLNAPLVTAAYQPAPGGRQFARLP